MSVDATDAGDPLRSSGAPLEPTARWMASVGGAAIASAGSDLAVAYLEAGTNALMVQRLDGAGHTNGVAVALGKAMRDTRLALAADGKEWVACWNATASDLQCGAVSLADGAVLSPARHLVDGVSPSLASSDGVIALSYLPQDPALAPSDLAVVRLGQGVIAGPPSHFGAECGSDACSPFYRGASLLTPTRDGFLLLSGLTTIKAYWLDTALTANGPAIDLGHPSWFSLSAAASSTGGSASICVAKPYGFAVVTIDRTHVLSSTEAGPNDSGKTGLALGLFPEAGAVSSVWGAHPESARRGALTSALAVTVFDGAPLGVARTQDSVMAVTQDNDGVLVVSRAPSKE